MEEHIIERLSRQLGTGVNRRSLAGLGVASWVMTPTDTEGKRKKKKKKKKKPTPPTTKPPAKGCKPACGSGFTCANGACVSTTNLQAAIDAAAPGATVTLDPGTWRLTSTLLIDQDLTLRGDGAGHTILDGANAVRVLTVQAGATVTLENLTIANGKDAAESDSCGGIVNEGTLHLRGVEVSNCEAEDTGGILNNGTLHLYEGTRIHGNRGGTGGIFTGEWASLTLHPGSVIISGNSGEWAGGLNAFKCPVTMAAGNRISGNSAQYGGGVVVYETTFTMQDGSIIGGSTPADANTAEEKGGGVMNRGIVTLESGSQVIGNSAAQGGGLFNDAHTGSITLKAGSRVSGNSATEGAAIYNDAGATIIQSGGLVCGNIPLNNQCEKWIGSISGACPVSGGVCPT